MSTKIELTGAKLGVRFFGTETPKPDGWQVALEIADWLPGQTRIMAIEQIERLRREACGEEEPEKKPAD